MINDYEATTPITTDARIPENTGLSNDDVISELNKLIEVCKDGQEGFKIVPIKFTHSRWLASSRQRCMPSPDMIMLTATMNQTK